MVFQIRHTQRGSWIERLLKITKQAMKYSRMIKNSFNACCKFGAILLNSFRSWQLPQYQLPVYFFSCFQTGSVLNKVQNFQNKSVLVVHGSADGKHLNYRTIKVECQSIFYCLPRRFLIIIRTLCKRLELWIIDLGLGKNWFSETLTFDIEIVKLFPYCQKCFVFEHVRGPELVFTVPRTI